MDFDVEALLANTRTWLRGRDPAAPDGDPALFRSGRPGAFHNGLSRLVGDDVDAAIDQARAYFRDVPWLWWYGEDSRPGVADDLLARGATTATEMQVMAVRLDKDAHTSPTTSTSEPDIDSRPGFASHAGLAIEEVTSDESLAEWTRAYLAGMTTDPEDPAAVLESERNRSDRPGTYRRFLGRVDGHGVATSALMLTGEVAGLYVVGVDPAFRKRGYGTAMSAAALAAARASGAAVATLQSRPAARPIYERLGFVGVSTYRLVAL